MKKLAVVLGESKTLHFSVYLRPSLQKRAALHRMVGTDGVVKYL